MLRFLMLSFSETLIFANFHPGSARSNDPSAGCFVIAVCSPRAVSGTCIPLGVVSLTR